MLKILKTYHKFYTRKKLTFFLFLVLLIIVAVLRNISPYFFKLFVDNITVLNAPKLLKILGGYMLVKVALQVFAVIYHYVGDLLLLDSAADARTKIFSYLQDLDFSFHTSKSTGSLISIMKRGDGAYFSLQHDIYFHIIPTVVGFITMLYFFSFLDIRIFLLVIGSFILTILVSLILIKYNMKTRKVFNENEDHISGLITDSIINYDTVKLFSKERWETNRLIEDFKDWKKTLWGYANSFRIMNITIDTIFNISIFLILFVTLQMVSSVKISPGDFVLVTGFISAFYPQLDNLIWGIRDIAKGFTDIEKYFSIFNYPIEVKDPENPIKKRKVKGDVDFANISYSYKEGQQNALRSLSLKIKKGESVALVGRSGAGKTTLIKLLMRFYDPEKGTIYIDGIDIKKFTKSQLRNFMGVVPQEPILFNNTISYNIGYPKINVSQKEIENASKLAHIDSFIKKLPNGYKTLVGERGVKLSGGQKQRLAIARMIVSNPDIIIFDEATSQLDSESEKYIQDSFWKVSEGKTTIIIAHRLSTAMRADRIIVLDQGKIIEEGSHTTLLNKKEGLYRKFWNLQTKLD
ncbi:ABC transporter ATP-binding protein/permease [Patescibacteria group bacterium]|nr:ABC transporter ATP-binding protein/permease [Patescibacteria group bacterium]